MHAIAAFLAIGAPTDLQVPAHGRHLSEPPILAYYPASSVVDHNRIDLDQAALEGAFGSCTATATSTCTGMAEVEAVYKNGGNSAPQGACTIAAPGVTTAFAKKAVLKYRNAGGAWATKKSSASAAVGDTTIKFYYVTSSGRTHSANTCLWGGLPGVTSANAPSECLTANAEIEVGGVTYTCTAVDNTKASRTLQGFSTKAKKLMYDPTMSSCPAEVTSKSYKNGCPYTSYTPYYDYYCKGGTGCASDGGYADRIVLAAIASGKTDLVNGNVDFAAAAGVQLKEVIKKGTAYMHAWMYAVREFEDAIDDCTGNTLTLNDMSSGSVHAWDEGVAFYTGSKLETGHLSGSAGSATDDNFLLNGGVGKLAYDLGNKRCKNFKTCGRSGDMNSGQSQQNYMLFDLFNEGQVDFRTGNCGAVVPVKNKIVQWMTIPLVQGTLRYAYECGVASGSLKGRAEGAIFALAVLPQVHACDATAAKTIYDNVVATMSNGGAINFNNVKAAFEGCYSKMFPDIAKPCAAVGTYGGSSGTQDLTATANTAACTDPETAGGMPQGTLIAIIVGAVVAVVLALFLLFLCCRERAGKPVFKPMGAQPKA